VILRILIMRVRFERYVIKIVGMKKRKRKT